MHFTTAAVLAVAATAVSAQTTGAKGDAPVTTGNSDMLVYAASFMSPQVQMATLNFTGPMNGTGVLVQACFTGINATAPGPFAYHIHAKAVPADGNCTATTGHFDPYERTQTPPCDSSMPETCEVGDLSGKHGKIPVAEYGAGPYCVSYHDNYLSLVPTDPAYIGDSLSVVIHNANTTRIACGNLTLVAGSNTETPTGNYTQAPVPVPTGAAGKIGASSLLLSIVVAAGALLL